jgi:hypothetical protein
VGMLIPVVPFHLIFTFLNYLIIVYLTSHGQKLRDRLICTYSQLRIDTDLPSQILSWSRINVRSRYDRYLPPKLATLVDYRKWRVVFLLVEWYIVVGLGRYDHPRVEQCVFLFGNVKQKSKDDVLVAYTTV